MPTQDQKNKKMLFTIFGVVVGMVMLAYASVPLYRLFCQVTGWGGTTQVAEADSNQQTRKVFDRVITVRFSANTARDMPWQFRPDVNKMDVKVGQDGFTSFVAENKTSKPIIGTAVYNVTPLKVGKYFFKTQCFCFSEQVLTPHEKMDMPVTFFIDPAIMDDPHMDDIKTITLSYTFFRADSEELDKATEAFYNTDSGTNIN